MGPKNSLDYEKQYWNDYPIIAGCDEVGRGCCAGPLVTCAVIFPTNYHNPLIKDSKQLSSKQREYIYKIIQQDALHIAYEFISAAEVDQLNPKRASQIGMRRCVEQLQTTTNINLIITDFEHINIDLPQINIIKGDTQSISVAAASIIAKVLRDRFMIDLATKYPQYHFDKHKGYNTKIHLEAINKYGIIPNIHRISYKNIQSILNK
ncbi:ribonuclease HII [Ureaplasma sp. ES3154-GEN]|uniref:ribonuclease HII n=1 Tax=Ureaplasma sp. ES3154-GEN TaxID=2984844 RepID=UPI0021E7C990|nr:ribonuclease HII [Ureaplasma sp. ES3154-GEN]MCV3743355.1 ribonuclease HII [Ureaplasma sp. ES3154-GEN]